MSAIIRPKSQNAPQFRNYSYQHVQLAKLEKSLVSPFLKLMMEPEPPQNPNGYRETDQRAEKVTSILFEKLGALPSKKMEIVEIFDASKTDVYISNSNGRLLVGMVSPPTYLDWGKGINSHEEAHASNKPNRLVATMQWAGMVMTLLDLGVKVYIAKPSQAKKEGVFTCDIGFVVEDKLFMGNMSMKERWPEMGTVKGGVQVPQYLRIEGGDVYVFKNGVFVGNSGRTDSEAADWLQGQVSRKVVPIKLNKISLHFDVPILPIDRHRSNGGGALVYPPGVNSNSIRKLEEVYGKDNIHRVSKEMFEGLRANIQVVDAGTAMVDFGETHVERTLQNFGFKNLIEVPYYEVKKGGGSHHCSILALVRED